MAHIIDRGHSISAGASALSKLNAHCRLYDPSRPVVHYVIQVCTCRKRLPRFQTNMRVTKSIAMCRIEMKRCRFGVQNGVFSVDESGKSIVSLEGKSGKTISIGCRFPPKFPNSGTLVNLLINSSSTLEVFTKKQQQGEQFTSALLSQVAAS